MNQILLIILINCLVAAAYAAPLAEQGEVVDGMKSAFKNGLNFFGDAVAKEKNYIPKPDLRKGGVLSHYSASVPKPIGGGKASLSEQYRTHNYVPQTPVVIPHEHSIVQGKMTPKDAAERYVPHAPLQYTTDQMFSTGKSGRR